MTAAAVATAAHSAATATAGRQAQAAARPAAYPAAARATEACAQRGTADSPSAIAVLKDTSNARWADVDCAQAVQNMANAAWALGLGTCWVGNFDARKLGEMLGVPQGWAIFTILPFGYPDLENPPQPRPLKPRREMVHYERHGNPKP